MATIDSMVLGDWSPFVLIKTEFFKQTEKISLHYNFHSNFVRFLVASSVFIEFIDGTCMDCEEFVIR